MKNKNIWYLGYVLGGISLIIAFSLNLNNAVDILLIGIFAMSVSLSHTQILHGRMMEKSSHYKVSVTDERNERIRDKVNAAMASVFMLLMGGIAVVCLAVEAYIPAILLAMALGISPLVMYFIHRYYESQL